MEYLLKASAVIAIFYLSYKIFLQRETFFESNRWFLLIGLIMAFIIPFIVIPVYITQSPDSLQEYMFVESSTTITSTGASLNLLNIVSIVYLIGVTFFSIRFVIQFYSLFQLLVSNKKQKQGDYTFIETQNDVSPFSFFKWIVYNPSQFSEIELKQIISHEKAHAKQHHSIDIIISQLALIIFWFNPFIWLYKKNLQQNLEFIADYNAQNASGCKKSYQYLLLKSSVPTHQLALTNNFYNSLIKKRIVMLHKSKSNKFNLWKYALVIPALAIFLMSFNTEEVYLDKPIEENVSHSLAYPLVEKSINSSLNFLNEKSNSVISNTQNSKLLQDREMILITKVYKDSDLDAVKTKLSKEGITVKFKGIKRNNDNEITAIKIDVSSKQSNANYNISTDAPINPIKISFDSEGGNISIGNANIIHGDGFVFETKDGKHKLHSMDKDNNELHFDEDYDGKVEVIVKEIGKDSKNGKNVHVIKKHGGGKIHTITSDDEVIDIDFDDDSDADVDIDVIVIKEDIKHIKESNFVIKEGKSLKIKSKGNRDKVFFVTNGEEPLFILDGKEVIKGVIDDLDSDGIETIEVLKGDIATEKYGDKAKDGVVEVFTKKKD